MEKPAIMTEQEVMETLSKIARADIGDHIHYGTVIVEGGKDAQGNPIPSRMFKVDVEDSDTVDTELVEEFSVGGDGVLRIKMFDKLAALDMLCRYFDFGGSKKVRP